MRFYDFFGNNSHRRPNNSDWNRDSAENDDLSASSETRFTDEENNDDWINHDNDHHGMLYRFGVDGFHDDLFSIMDQFMKGFHFSPHQMPPLPPEHPMQRQHEQSLRSQVLKQPDSDQPALDQSSPKQPEYVEPPTNDFNSMVKDFFGQSFFAPFLNDIVPKEDKDLDKDVVDHGLEAVLDQHDKSLTTPGPFASTPHSFFHGTMESRSKILRSDGSSEERITKRDSQGNEETTIIYGSADGQRRTVVERGDDVSEFSSRPEDVSHRVLKDPTDHRQPLNQGFNLFARFNKVFEEIFSK